MVEVQRPGAKNFAEKGAKGRTRQAGTYDGSRVQDKAIDKRCFINSR